MNKVNNEKKLLQTKDGFKQHLISNKHVFLSGRYGIGKTTFIKGFFENNKNEYIAIHLFPVNYSIVDNRDVFELIKSDILYSLLDYIDPKDLASIDSIYKTPLAGFIAENFDSIFLGFLKLAGGLGKKIYEIAEELKVLKEEYEKHKKTNESSLKDHIEIFGEKYKDQIGHLYENDAFTELIQSLLDYLKETTGKELVLIIDDLDRIDPDHIFRILNIFSSHFDRSMTTNDFSDKFDFDKIILIADYYNLKSIYHHKYGANTKFSGYIDKFYTSTRYNLSYEDAVAQYLDIFFRDVQLQRSDHYGIVNFVLSILFKNNKISFRTLLKNKHVFLNSKLDNALKSHEIIYQMIGDGSESILAVSNCKFNVVDKREYMNHWHYNIRIVLNEIFDKAPYLFTKEDKIYELIFKDIKINATSTAGNSGYYIRADFDSSDSFTLQTYFGLIKLLFQILNGESITKDKL